MVKTPGMVYSKKAALEICGEMEYQYVQIFWNGIWIMLEYYGTWMDWNMLSIE